MAGADLIVEQSGAFVGKHSERIRVTVQGVIVAERPVYGLEQVLIASRGVSLSSDVIQECAERGVPIVFLGWNGAAYARLSAPGLGGTVRTRREQLLAYGDERGVTLAKAIAAGKLQNQANLLRYMVKNYRSEVDLFNLVHEAALRIMELGRAVADIEGPAVDELRMELLTLEAHAAKEYWEAARVLVEIDEWTGRETRGATDLVNSCLNYGYGVLYAKIEHAVTLAGLDPFAGFIHADRSGKPSLVLDLIEEFRQPVVDRTVFGLLNRGSKLDLVEGRLSDATRRLLAQRVMERLDSEEPHEGKRHRLRTIVQMQARRVASHVRGDAIYRAWVSR